MIFSKVNYYYCFALLLTRLAQLSAETYAAQNDYDIGAPRCGEN